MSRKNLRVLRCKELLQFSENDPAFLDSVVTGDEFWMFEYDPKSKRQSSEWHTVSSPQPYNAWSSLASKQCSFLVIFFDVRRIVHFEFLQLGQIVSAVFYLQVLKRLKHRVTRFRGNIKDLMKFDHDNAPSHTIFIVVDYLAPTLVDYKGPSGPSAPLRGSQWLSFVSLLEERAQGKTLRAHKKHSSSYYKVFKRHSLRLKTLREPFRRDRYVSASILL